MPAVAREFYPYRPVRSWNPRNLPFSEYRELLLGRKVDHSLPSAAEIKNEWSLTSPTLIRLQSLDKGRFAFLSEDVFRNPYCIAFSGSELILNNELGGNGQGNSLGTKNLLKPSGFFT